MLGRRHAGRLRLSPAPVQKAPQAGAQLQQPPVVVVRGSRGHREDDSLVIETYRARISRHDSLTREECRDRDSIQDASNDAMARQAVEVLPGRAVCRRVTSAARRLPQHDVRREPWAASPARTVRASRSAPYGERTPRCAVRRRAAGWCPRRAAPGHVRGRRPRRHRHRRRPVAHRGRPRGRRLLRRRASPRAACSPISIAGSRSCSRRWPRSARRRAGPAGGRRAGGLACRPAAGRPCHPRGMRILFVCIGNICRSPTAEGVMRQLVARGRARRTSRGRQRGHRRLARRRAAGRSARPRRRAGAASRSRARRGRFAPADFERFDLSSRWTARTCATCSPWRRTRRRARRCGCCASSTPTAPATSTCPTRTTAATRGFEEVLDMVEAACRGLLDELRAARREPRGRGRARDRPSRPARCARRRRRHQRGLRASSSTTAARCSSRRAPTRPPGEYAAEAAALRWLGRAGRGARARGARRRRRAPRARVDRARAPARRRGARSAAGWPRVHAAGRRGVRRAAAAAARPAPLQIGPLALPNDPLPDWPAFYAERRLGRCSRRRATAAR